MLNWTIEEELLDITADLLALQKTETFLVALFKFKAGNWYKATSMCEGLLEYTEKIQNVQNRIKLEENNSESELLVSWQHLNQHIGFCTVSFFVPECMWYTIAIYNRRRLMKLSD